MIALAAMGAAFLTGRPRLVRYAVWFGIVFCLADWVLVQDLGFLGGLGTDPNSMIPLILLFSAGYLALAPEVTGEMIGAERGGRGRRGWRRRTADRARGAGDAERRGRLRPGVLSGLGDTVASARARSVAAVGALAVIVLGAAPMATAAANRTADPILALAISGNSSSLDLPAPGFSLTDQDGRTVSLASLRGKVVLMTFLDPVCTTDCPIIAQEFKQAGQMLGAQARHVELVAVVANPTYRSTAFTRAFDRQEGLATVPNWLYLTGSLGQLGAVWRHYGVTVQNLPAGAMSAHNDLAVIIDPAGRIRQEMDADPGPGTSGTQSSFSVLLSQYARQALRQLVIRAAGRPGARGAAGLRGAGLRGPDRRLRVAAGRGDRRRPAAADRAAGHLAGHRAGHLGRRGHGRPGRRQQVLAALLPARDQRPLVAGHPAGRGRQRRPGRGGRRRLPGRGLPPEPEPGLLPAGHQHRHRPELDAWPARRRAGRHARRHRGRAVGAHPRAAAGRHDRGGADGGCPRPPGSGRR